MLRWSLETSTKPSTDADNIDLLGTVDTPITPINSPFPTSPPPLFDGNGSTISIPSGLSQFNQNLTVDPNIDYLAVGESVVITYSSTSLTAPPPPPIQPPSPSPAPTMLRWSPPSPPTKPRTIPATSIDLLGTASDAINSDQLSVSNQSPPLPSPPTLHSLSSGHSQQNLTVDHSTESSTDFAVGESVVITYSYDVADGSPPPPNTTTITITGGNDAPVASSPSNKILRFQLLHRSPRTASDTDNTLNSPFPTSPPPLLITGSDTASIRSGETSLSHSHLDR